MSNDTAESDSPPPCEYVYEVTYAPDMRFKEVPNSAVGLNIGNDCGHILLYVNDHYALDDDLEDVEAFLQMLNDSKLKIKLKFLDTSMLSIEKYLKRHPPKKNIKNDAYGFQRTEEYIQAEKNHSRAQSQAIIQRDLDWIEYFNQIGGVENLKANNIFKSPTDLKQLVRRGIPIAYRALVWSRISLSSSYRSFYPPDYYLSLLLRVYEIPKKVKEEIEKDLDRTFPQHEYFSSQGVGEDSLRQVLRAFALHKKDIGYCQSLNFVVAFMLLLMSEEDSFWLLVTLVDTVLPPDYYTASMIGSNTDHFVFCELIRTRLPRIHCFLELNNIEFPLVTLQWFMCLFVNTLRPEVTLRVWDMLFNEGSKVLFRIGIALIKMNEREILSVKDSGDLIVLLNRIGGDIIDADSLISFAYKSFNQSKARSPMFGASWGRINRAYSLPELRGLGVAHKGVVPSSGRNSPLPSADFEILSTEPPEESAEAPELENVSPTSAKTESDFEQPVFFNLQLPSFKIPQMSRSSNEYRSFKRVEIETLRFRFRQQVFEAHKANVQAKEEWLRQQQESR